MLAKGSYNPKYKSSIGINLQANKGHKTIDLGDGMDDMYHHQVTESSTAEDKNRKELI